MIGLIGCFLGGFSGGSIIGQRHQVHTCTAHDLQYSDKEHGYLQDT